MSVLSGPVPAPRNARRAIESDFVRKYRKAFGRSPSKPHPRAVDLLWHVSRRDLGRIRAGTARVLSEAAARGYPIDLGTVYTRWPAAS